MYVCIGNRVCMYVRTRTRTHAHSRAHTHAHTCTLLANPVDEERPACIVTPHMPGGSLDQRLRAGRGGVGGRGVGGSGVGGDAGGSSLMWEDRLRIGLQVDCVCVCVCLCVCVRVYVCLVHKTLTHLPT